MNQSFFVSQILCSYRTIAGSTRHQGTRLPHWFLLALSFCHLKTKKTRPLGRWILVAFTSSWSMSPLSWCENSRHCSLVTVGSYLRASASQFHLFCLNFAICYSSGYWVEESWEVDPRDASEMKVVRIDEIRINKKLHFVHLFASPTFNTSRTGRWRLRTRYWGYAPSFL